MREYSLLQSLVSGLDDDERRSMASALQRAMNAPPESRRNGPRESSRRARRRPPGDTGYRRHSLSPTEIDALL